MQQWIRRIPGSFRSIIVAVTTVSIFVGSASAETAMLDCLADAALAGKAQAATELRVADGILIDFQWQTVTSWRVTKATLLVHLAKGSAPIILDVALAPDTWVEARTPSISEKRLKFLAQKVETHPDGWIALDVPPSMVELAAEGKAHGFVVRDRVRAKERWLHTRRSGQYAPHLLVEGSPVGETIK
jgi:hypothetical protein